MYDALGGIPEVKILDSPTKTNGHVPNGHSNGQAANGHVGNGNGHLPNGEPPSTTTPFLNGDTSLHADKDNVHTTHIIPRSPRLGTPHRRQYVPLEANDDEDEEFKGKMIPMVESQPENSAPIDK